jgi:hypothetical protein
MAMKLKFKTAPTKFKGGERYSVDKFYYLSREEACLWIKRDVVDVKTLQAADLTDEAIAENEKNLGKGHALTLQETLQALSEIK